MHYYLLSSMAEYLYAPLLYLMEFMFSILHDYRITWFSCNYRYFVYLHMFLRFRKSHLQDNIILDFEFAAWYGILLMLCGSLFIRHLLVGCASL